MIATVQADTGQHPLRVLLVEDDEDDYLCTRDLLRDMGEGRFALDWVVKFEDAVAAMARHEHDVYLVDYRLGDHNGLELLNEASRNGAPVILLTGLDDRAVDLLAMQAGAVDYLVKGQIDAALLDRSIRYAIERKQMEEALRRQAEALREADHHKDEFLAMLAHELRNPLAPIHNAVQLIKAINLSDPKLNHARDIIERQAGQLALLVEDLLDVSRIIHGKFKLHMERVELAQVVAQAVETSRPNIEARKHELTVSLPTQPLHLDTDIARLVQVLSNLLNNAAKYTPEGGRINLTIIREDREAVIRVRDTGIGIPVDMVGRVFEMFTQIDQHLDQSQGGLGIGLTLVKRLTEMHGGSVHVHSEGEGMGAEFVLRLPLADSKGLRSIVTNDY